jgi:hypothetical protein
MTVDGSGYGYELNFIITSNIFQNCQVDDPFDYQAYFTLQSVDWMRGNDVNYVGINNEVVNSRPAIPNIHFDVEVTGGKNIRIVYYAINNPAMTYTSLSTIRNGDNYFGFFGKTVSDYDNVSIRNLKICPLYSECTK